MYRQPLVVDDTCNHANEVVLFEHHKQYCLRAMNTLRCNSGILMIRWHSHCQYFIY